MTREQRIRWNRDAITGLREQIDWLRSSGFSIGEHFTQPGQSTEDLIAHHESRIAVHERIIEELEGRADA